LTKLDQLYLYANRLTGSIPLEIFKLTKLFNLCLEENLLSGTIPPEIGNLRNLWSLYLRHNQLTGSIPPEIGNTNLHGLILSGNQLTGSIPHEIGKLKNLAYLRLDNNKLTGPIPPEVWNLTHLEELLLSFNQLTGSIPSEINNLSFLETLEINNNEFINLPPLTSDSLIFLWVQNNRLTFIDIEPNINIARKTFTYSPQDSIGIKQYINSRIGNSYTFIADCGGANNLYQWYRNKIIIPSATSREFIIYNMKQSDAGSYTCSVTNTIVSGLTINSRPYIINVELNGRTIDSLALVTLYNATGGTSWTNNKNWLSNMPISEWYGVTVGTNGSKGALNDTTSVIKLELSGNNLSGALPKEIGNLTSLKTLNLDNNNLTGSVPAEINNLSSLKKLELSNNMLDELPTLTLLNLDTLLINNNQFSFDDIVPNLSVPNIGINYMVQDSIGTIIDTICKPLSNIRFTVIDSTVQNEYQWYKNNISLAGATDKEFVISGLQLADSGSYTCKITNSTVPGLTLYQRPVILHVSLRTGIDDIRFLELKIYPNPSGGIFNIEAVGILPGNSKAIVTDISGKTVLIKDFADMQRQELSLEHLSKGLYFLRIQNKNRVFYQKIIIR
jgi:Leucine-rich repeat (LRR) protein